MVAVDPFTKWVEAGPITNLRAATIVEWFHSSIVCRFGAPAWVRVDRGTEFQGAFIEYCADSGIWIKRISSHNPRANG